LVESHYLDKTTILILTFGLSKVVGTEINKLIKKKEVFFEMYIVIKIVSGKCN